MLSKAMMKLFVFVQLLSSASGLLNVINLRSQLSLQKSRTSLRISPLIIESVVTDMPDAAQLERVLQVATEAAKKAGVLIRDNIGARVKYSKTNYKVSIFSTGVLR